MTSKVVCFLCRRIVSIELYDLWPFCEPKMTKAVFLSWPNSKSTRNINISIFLLIARNNSLEKRTWSTSFKYLHIHAYRYQYCSRRFNTLAPSTLAFICWIELKEETTTTYRQNRRSLPLFKSWVIIPLIMFPF